MHPTTIAAALFTSKVTLQWYRAGLPNPVAGHPASTMALSAARKWGQSTPAPLVFFDVPLFSQAWSNAAVGMIGDGVD